MANIYTNYKIRRTCVGLGTGVQRRKTWFSSMEHNQQCNEWKRSMNLMYSTSTQLIPLKTPSCCLYVQLIVLLWMMLIAHFEVTCILILSLWFIHSWRCKLIGEGLALTQTLTFMFCKRVGSHRQQVRWRHSTEVGESAAGKDCQREVCHVAIMNSLQECWLQCC